jgi:exopolyphosphatase/guanosine-5'-triphosphate,3'-diphosphate pyrophosphatase
MSPVHRAPRREVQYYAALDLGTNNCRLLIGAPTPGGFRVVDSFSRIVRLGEGLAATGRLGEAAMERAIAALAACADKLARRPVRSFAAVATEACRQASNGREFLARVTQETGIAPRVIGGREEAQLALASCAPLLNQGDRRAILFDIGGGSTEITWVRLAAPGSTAEPILSGTISIPVGVVTLAERAGESCFTREGFAAVRDEVAARLRAFDAVHCIGQEIRQGGVRLIGTSGTVTTLAGASGTAGAFNYSVGGNLTVGSVLGVVGITVLGPLPEAVQITTTCSGSIAATCVQAQAVQALLRFWASEATAPTKLRHGLKAA